MNDTVAVALTVASLALAVWALVHLVLGRPLDNPLFYGLAVLEAALVVQLVGGAIALAGTDRDVDGVSFIGYLLTALLILPLAVVWSLAEKTRWGISVLVLGPLVIAFLVLRLRQIWTGGA